MSKISRRNWKQWSVCASLVVGGLIMGLGAAEAMLRLTFADETFGTAVELPWMRATTSFVVDPSFGFRPAFGREYTETGTHQNNYPSTRPDSIVRVLYIGDSVTHRGRIVNALKTLYGDERFEHWNAGVESFNTVQEVEYYRRYNRAIQPDHIVVTLHNNDFGTTPVAFRNAEGQLVVFTPGAPQVRLNPTLFRHSMFYRLIIGSLLTSQREDVVFEDEVRSALHTLQQIAVADGTELTVVVLPILKEHAGWTPQERRNHDAAVRLLTALGIRFFDLLAPLEQAISSGLTLTERPGDVWHPSDDAAERFASYLFDRGLLAPATRE